MKSYRVTVFKTVELHDFEYGCHSDSFRDHGLIFEFNSSDLELLKSRLKSVVDIDLCEDLEGRLDYQTNETDDGEKASKQCLEAWKKGPKALEAFNTKLWLATYSVCLESVETTELNANLLKGVK